MALIFQEDLGAELFNLNSIFPDAACADTFLNFLEVINTASQVIGNTGPFQDTFLSQFTEGDTFYVDALKQGSLYNFNIDVDNPDNTIKQLPSATGGDCLVYKKDNGGLRSEGVDCNSIQKPLCVK